MLAMIFVTLMLFVISFLLLLPIAWTTNSTRNATTTQTPVYYDGRIWDVVVKTCDLPNAGTDAAAYLKIFYEAGHDSETFQLDNPAKDDFERASRDHFKIFFKQSDLVNVGLFWWPGLSLSPSWCVEWVLILNSEVETCFEAIFEKWILHYRDPPTYAAKFHRLKYVDCVSPAAVNANRKHYMRYDDNIADGQ